MKPTKLSTGAILGVLSLMTAGGVIAQGVLFDDVPQGHWARPHIEWAYQSKIMTGPGDQTRAFAPERPTNRAELAAVSHRLYTVLRAEMDLLAARVESLEHADDDQVSNNDEERTKYHFSAVLTGEREVPLVNTDATGTGVFRLEENDLWYNITIDNLSGNFEAAHFHQARAGVNGPVVEPIEFTGNTATGWWTNLSQDELEALMAGEIYVNVHSDEYPDGEIRAQLNVN